MYTEKKYLLNNMILSLSMAMELFYLTLGGIPLLLVQLCWSLYIFKLLEGEKTA